MTKKGRIALRVILTALSAAAVGFIFYNSSLDAVRSSEQSGSLLDSINAFLQSLGLGIELSDHFIRKTAHFVEYFVLGLLLSGTWYAYIGNRKKTLFLAPVCGLFVAVCDELIQLGSAGRSCEVADMALDFSAVICAALALTLILLAAQKKRERKEAAKNE